MGVACQYGGPSFRCISQEGGCGVLLLASCRGVVLQSQGEPIRSALSMQCQSMGLMQERDKAVQHLEGGGLVPEPGLKGSQAQPWVQCPHRSEFRQLRGISSTSAPRLSSPCHSFELALLCRTPAQRAPHCTVATWQPAQSAGTDRLQGFPECKHRRLHVWRLFFMSDCGVQFCFWVPNDHIRQWESLNESLRHSSPLCSANLQNVCV